MNDQLIYVVLSALANVHGINAGDTLANSKLLYPTIYALGNAGTLEADLITAMNADLEPAPFTPGDPVGNLDDATWTPVAGVYADLAAARTSVALLATETANAVASLRQKQNELLTVLRAISVITT